LAVCADARSAASARLSVPAVSFRKSRRSMSMACLPESKMMLDLITDTGENARRQWA